MIVSVPGCELPSTGLKVTRTSTLFGFGGAAMVVTVGEVYAPSLYTMLAMWSVASPVFLIVNVNDLVDPLLTTP